MDKMINRIISLIFVLALLGEEVSCNHDEVTISDANPIQFWVNGEETFNEKDICGIHDICFCQQFQCDDEIRIQFTDSIDQNYELVIYDTLSVEIDRMDFVEVENGVYEIVFTPGTTCEKINFTIEKIVLNAFANGASAANNAWLDVTYGNSLLVAVSNTGALNEVMTSANGGVSWTIRTTPNNNQWNGVAYGGGMYVAIANSGVGNRVMSSPDGITWTARVSAADNGWNAVTYGNGTFVAVASSGSGNRVMTSPDGITWTIRTSAADNSWTSVTYGEGLFVAVANTGTANRVMTSPDGFTWTIRVSARDRTWTSVTYGAGIFVAVSLDGTDDQAMTSPDGITWTIQNTPSSGSSFWSSVTYGAGLFVAVNLGNAKAMVSNDGELWNLVTIPNQSWQAITYDSGLALFVAVASSGSGNRAMYASYVTTVAATSDCIDLKEEHECSQLIQYTNSNDFAGLVYPPTSSPDKDFFIRVPAMFFEEDFPEEFEALDLSDSQSVQLRSEVKAKKMLDLDRMPFYMHKKLKLILAHDSVTIDGDEWMKLDGYAIQPPASKHYPLRRAQAWLTNKNFIERNVL